MCVFMSESVCTYVCVIYIFLKKTRIVLKKVRTILKIECASKIVVKNKNKRERVQIWSIFRDLAHYRMQISAIWARQNSRTFFFGRNSMLFVSVCVCVCDWCDGSIRVLSYLYILRLLRHASWHQDLEIIKAFNFFSRILLSLASGKA